MAPAASGGTSSANPFAGARLYVNSFSNAARTAAAWRAHGRIADGRIADARALAKIAQHPQAVWFGDWNGADPSPDVRDAVGSARAAGALPVLVAYDIPGPRLRRLLGGRGAVCDRLPELDRRARQRHRIGTGGRDPRARRDS